MNTVTIKGWNPRTLYVVRWEEGKEKHGLEFYQLTDAENFYDGFAKSRIEAIITTKHVPVHHNV